MTKVDIPLVDPGDQGAFGNVGTVVYRDTVLGVRYTAHLDGMTGAGWVVKHEGQRGDSDGTPVARTAMVYGYGALNSLWAAVRSVPEVE